MIQKKNYKKKCVAVLVGTMIIGSCSIMQATSIKKEDIYTQGFEGEVRWSEIYVDRDTNTWSVTDTYAAENSTKSYVSTTNSTMGVDNLVASTEIAIPDTDGKAVLSWDYMYTISEGTFRDQSYSLYLYPCELGTAPTEVNSASFFTEHEQLYTESAICATEGFIHKSVEIPNDYKGKSVLLLLRHHNSDGCEAFLYLDNVKVEKEIPCYDVTVSSSTNGIVSASASQVVQGKHDEITLTTTPAAGYELKSLKVFDSNNVAINVQNSKFNMPDSDVTITAEFSQIVDNTTTTGDTTTKGSTISSTATKSTTATTGAETKNGSETLPQTGVGIQLIDIVKITVVLAIISLISLIIIDKKKKNKIK